MGLDKGQALKKKKQIIVTFLDLSLSYCIILSEIFNFSEVILSVKW